jgi:hypothetical protein
MIICQLIKITEPFYCYGIYKSLQSGPVLRHTHPFHFHTNCFCNCALERNVPCLNNRNFTQRQRSLYSIIILLSDLYHSNLRSCAPLWTPHGTSLIHSSEGASAALQSKKKSVFTALTMVIDFAPIPIASQ